MPYLPDLQAIHPSRQQPGEYVPPLADALELDRIRGYIEVSRELGDGAYRGAVLEVLPDIKSGIHNALDYRSPDTLQTSAETTAFTTLQKSQTTHCYGYTTVTSEALGLAGITHWVAHAGQHGFVVVPLPGKQKGGRELHVVDAMKTCLQGDISPALRDGSAPDLASQMNNRARPRGDAFLDLLVLADTQGFSSMAAFLDKHPFFTHKKQVANTRDERPLWNSEKGGRVVISTFLPHIGSLVLEQTAKFMAAAQHSNGRLAADALISIAGLYPQIDVHANHRDILDVVRVLSEQRSFRRAQRAVDNYCSSFVLSDHPDQHELQGDLLQMIAVAKQDNGLRARTRTAYHAARQRTHFPWAISRLDAKIASV
jgi:hypothetical protein